MGLMDYEGSADRGQPVELYKFIFGPAPTDFYAYSTGTSEVLHDTITYVPHPLKPGKIKSSGKITSSEVKIEVPLDSPVAELFRVSLPPQPVGVIVRQGHIPNGDDPASWALGENFPVVYTGTITETVRNVASVELVIEAASAGMRRPGLRRHYQWPCPHALYGSQCAASKAAAATTGTVDTIAGNRLTLAGTWQKQVPVDPEADPIVYQDIGAAYYIGGLVEWDTVRGRETKTILRVENSGATLVLSGTAESLDPLDAVDIYLGCPHTLEGCETVHDNVVNYGGQPWIPKENPVGKNNHT